MIKKNLNLQLIYTEFHLNAARVLNLFLALSNSYKLYFQPIKL